MDEFIHVVAATFSVLSILWYIKYSLGKRTPPLPPGPRGIPILGYLPFIGRSNNLFPKLTELGHKFGPIFKLNLGRKLCVVINSPSLAKEIVRTKDAVFSNRDASVANLAASYNASDVVFSETNSRWATMRKVFVREMMSTASLEASNELRANVVGKAVDYVRAHSGKPVKIGELTFRTELDVIMNMLWGGTIEGVKGEIIAAEFFSVVSKIIDLLGKLNVSDFFPVLARFDFQGVKREMEGYVKCVDRIFDDVIAQHEKKLSCGEIIKKQGKKDFLQILLELQNNQDCGHISISHTQIKAIMMVIN
ncbi:PREDICTED: premnaspirodiene oxygenase-like [Erythranthe guttata]|uniref:premnaspirodiene oxygenase-like n=1 Tax=Erythranthe guttata TaxID=4155 RepID=UPI00064DA063|nr:PREDICTED: premnaspirodiene oxygenase-like [Erythranthe guttata]|eukprot:XP_012851894.1 PREDICTED: premnaspirodiene oxygenase-like [Erythranthe guttata]